jgi:non-ribosomal peptide synthetase component F
VEAARARIAGVRALNLPTDRQRSAISTSRGHFASVTLDVAESERFAQLCQSAHVTAFMGVVAVLGMHVGQWCGSDDVVLISPMGTRVREDMRALAGSIANWIPLRVSLAGDPSVRDVLLRVRLDATQAYAHAAVPAALVYETPDLYAHPLGRVLVNMPAAEAGPTEAPEASIEMAGLTAFAEDDTPRPALCRTDLTFHVTRVDNRIDVRVRGDADLFDAATIAGCAARVGELLRTVTLDARVSSLR